MKLKIVEPLRLLFKDEVRRVGKSLGLADKFLKRHPFPGPGLAIRILGEITKEKVRLLQEADYIYISCFKKKVCTIKYGKLEPSCCRLRVSG